MEKEKHFFYNSGFEIKTIDKNEFRAKKAGRNSLLLKFVDFYFNKRAATLSLTEVKNFHEASIEIANSEFNVPRALRLTVPNINSVIYSKTTPNPDIIEFVGKLNKSVIGGQQDTLFIINESENKVYSPGISITKITGEVQLLWGNQKEFAKLNGHNRAHYFIQHMVQELYQFQE